MGREVLILPKVELVACLRLVFHEKELSAPGWRWMELWHRHKSKTAKQ
jgi:hypothetical protein